MAVLMAWPTQSRAHAPQPAAPARAAVDTAAWQGAASDRAQAFTAARGATLAFSPKLFNRLVNALSRRTAGPPKRSGQPRGGKANHDRVHTERYGEGSISGRERDWGEVTSAELTFARELAHRGFHVKIIPRRNDRRTPDFSVNGTTIELKTLQAFGKRTLEKQVRKAADQNADIIIINCRNVDARLESVQRQIRDAERTLKRSLEGKIIIWMPDGSVHTH